jgi:serine/threonine protein kinase
VRLSFGLCNTNSDFLAAHHYVYKHAKIIHRDLSDRNIMFLREAGRVKGKLCDWDLAKYVDDLLDGPELLDRHAANQRATPGPGDSKNLGSITESPEVGGPKATNAPAAHDDPMPTSINDERQPTPRHRTGTGPFIALDLLTISNFTAPVHVYRYDLESLFYILVKFCALFQPRTHDYHQNPKLDKWDTGSFDLMSDAKTRFLTDFNEYAAIMRGASPEFSVLGKKWVGTLYVLFGEAHSLAKTATRRWSISHISEEEERKTVAEVSSARDEALTYERFMAVIGEDAL